tara:strand:+ start:229 stop:1488 length:1260 start_codon:yes stop_codon:yes gene_type:complete
MSEDIRQRKTSDNIFGDHDGLDDDDEGDNIPQIVKQLDFNPKLKKSAEKNSSRGGVVSIIALLVTVWLISAEWTSYTSEHATHTVYVDTDREHPDELIKVYLDIEFRSIPCSLLSLDVVDNEGEQQPNARAHIVRTRIGANDVIGHLETTERGSAGVTTKSWVPPEGYCGSCYDVNNIPSHNPKSKMCCNTCTDLKRAYISHGLDFRIAQNSEQCLRATGASAQFDQEGCRIHGHLEVQQQAGNFHVAAGSAVTSDHASHKHHVHALTALDLLKFNSTHIISRLCFGRPDDDFSYPLQGKVWVDRRLSQVKYIMDVVPVHFEGYSDRQSSFLYSATRHNEEVDLTQPHYATPGVFFFYDFSAFQIKHTLHRRSFLYFVTRVCALVGGMFVVLGLVYRMLDSALVKLLGEERSSALSPIL